MADAAAAGVRGAEIVGKAIVNLLVGSVLVVGVLVEARVEPCTMGRGREREDDGRGTGLAVVVVLMILLAGVVIVLVKVVLVLDGGRGTASLGFATGGVDTYMTAGTGNAGADDDETFLVAVVLLLQACVLVAPKGSRSSPS
jgi:hypothetical protein